MSAALELSEAKELRESGIVRENRLSSKGARRSTLVRSGPGSPIEAVSCAREDAAVSGCGHLSSMLVETLCQLYPFTLGGQVLEFWSHGHSLRH